MNTKNDISESAQIIGDVFIGSGNFIGPGAVIIGPITIGDNNYFGANCVIGTPPQDEILSPEEHRDSSIGARNRAHRIEIGNRNVIREFVTIHQGLTTRTVISNNCYLMAYSHIAHDCFIDENVKIANSVQLGGYTTILRNSYIGLSAVIHQFTTIGAFTMIGMGSVVVKNVPPCVISFGNPSKSSSANQISLQKNGITDFDWSVEYLISPNIQDIHPSLREDFRIYENSIIQKLKLREEVTRFRNGKYSA
jgi:UDP-N-acetylglucosamine acyltransferase